MTSVEPGVLDANVLIYALDISAPHHTASRAVLDGAQSPATSLYVTLQILCEFYAVVTDRRRVSMPRTPAEAVSAIADILSLPGIHLLPVPVEAVSRWIALAQQRPVTGGRIFDLQIAATMQANGVNRIYTYNTGDFETFSGLTVTDPREAMA